MKESPRPGFLYWSDDGDLMALRYGNWKVHFMEQRAEGMLAWQEPFVPLRFPKLFNLRTDPFEKADVVRRPVLPEVACRPPLHAGAGRRAGRPVHADHDGVPAPAEPGELEPRNDMLEKLKEKAEAIDHGVSPG